MNRKDFGRLIGATSENSDYVPVAFLLRSGYGCAGYYNAALNDDFGDICVLLNAHLVELRSSPTASSRPAIHDFSEFLEEIVLGTQEDGSSHGAVQSEIYGRSIPLAAVPYDEIAVIYPVAHIGALMDRAKQQQNSLPTFLDLDKSEIVSLLRLKLW